MPRDAFIFPCQRAHFRSVIASVVFSDPKLEVSTSLIPGIVLNTFRRSYSLLTVVWPWGQQDVVFNATVYTTEALEIRSHFRESISLSACGKDTHKNV